MVHSRTRFSFPGLVFLKSGLGSIRGVVLGPVARTKMLGLPEQFGVAPPSEDVVELVYMGYPLSVLRGLDHSPCNRVAQIGRKTVRTWISLCKNRMVPMRRITGRSLGTVAGGLIVIGWVAVESQGIVVEAQLGRALLCPPGLLGEDVEGECGECVRSESFLEKFDPQFQQLKEEAKRKERTVELQERAEVFAQVMKEHFIKLWTPP